MPMESGRDGDAMDYFLDLVDGMSFEALVEEAKSAYGKAQEAFVNEPGPVDDAAKMLSDMVAVGDQMGLSGTR